MALKRKIEKATFNKSKWFILFAFPLILIGSIVGVIINHFNHNNKEVVDNNANDEYMYDYEYDENWEEVLKYTEEQREKYQNIECECG